MAEDMKDGVGSARGLLLSGLVILGLLGAGLWWSQGTSEVQSDPTQGAASSASAAGDPAGDAAGACSLADGAELRYRWGTKLSTKATNPLTDSGAPMSGRAALSGDLTLKVVEVRSSGWTLQVRVAVDDDAMKGLFVDGVVADLRSPFALEMGSDCAMERIGFPAAWGPETRAALHALLTPFDVGYPRGPGGASWNRTHADGRGRLLISYQAQDKARRRFHRRRLQYTKLWPGTPGEVSVQAQASTVSMAADGAWIESLEERVRYGVQRKGRPLVVEKIDYSLIRQPEAADEPTELMSLDGLQWMHLRDAPPRRETASLTKALPKTMESATLQEMVDGLLAVLEDSEKKRAAHALLVAYLKRFPERAAELERFIRDYPGASADLATLFRALKSAGTPEAQEALVRLMEDPAEIVIEWFSFDV
ncbi:MAG: hypothetical protein VX938_09395, partial [Myxococcota bacterium]|nr:hypothetical protein [Myxococcota bacterium]